MKKGISLRMRLTLITSLLLTLMCISFTVFSIQSANEIFSISEAQSYNMEEPVLVTETEESLNDYAEYGEPVAADADTFSNVSLIFMGISIVIGTLLMYILSGIALKPVRKLSKEIETIDKETLSNRIASFSSGDELNKLSNSFNGMMDRLQEAFEREQRFAAAAAHELKTPLTVIKTEIDVLELEEEPSDKEYIECLAIVKKQSNRMIDLVKELMNLSAVKEFEQEYIVDLDKMVQEIGQELSVLMRDKDIAFNMNLISCKIKGNGVMLKQALSNVVENAIKYNIEHGKIEVIMIRVDKICEIFIVDTGIGIPVEKKTLIFEPFYRLDKSRARSMGGAGLGLALTKEVIEKHRGTVEIIDNNPVGSKFIIKLPIA